MVTPIKKSGSLSVSGSGSKGSGLNWFHRYLDIAFADRNSGADGCDCWGLVRKVYADELGIDIEPGCYAHVKDSGGCGITAARAKEQWIRVPRPERQPFDIVCFSILRDLWHVGVVVDHRLMLHVEQGRVSCLERYDSIRWGRRTDGFYRHPAMDDRPGDDNGRPAAAPTGCACVVPGGAI